MVTIRAHNIADYFLGATFIATPFAFGFSHVYFAQDVFLVLGVAVIGYSLLTDYAHSISKAIPLGMHMTFDAVCGIFVVLAPWIYGYREELSLFQVGMHWALGIAAIALPMLTNTHTQSGSIDRPSSQPVFQALRGTNEAIRIKSPQIENNPRGSKKAA
jgi:hypothetical protein